MLLVKLKIFPKNAPKLTVAKINQMYVKRNYSFRMTFNWSKKPFLVGFLYAGIVTSVFCFLEWDVSLPWQAVSIIGIAVAFYLGFKNNSSYDRTWEARKIWGSIVNNSRSFGAAVTAFLHHVGSVDEKKELIYRHIAWLTALRYQLRLSRPWEHTEDRLNGLYNPEICEAYFDQMDREIIHFIPDEEFQRYKKQANVATQILAKQSLRLQELRDTGQLNDFRHIALQNLITAFYEDQGKCERIKNFPFPRQYASAGLWITVIFSAVLPLGLLDTFAKLEGWGIWLTVPTSALVTWVFFLMEMISDYSVNLRGHLQRCAHHVHLTSHRN